MHTERLAFLDDVEFDLTTTMSSTSVDVGSPATAGHAKRLMRRISMAGAVLLAAVSYATLPAGAAHASTAGVANPAALNFCWLPYAIPRDHTRSCDNWITFYNHDFISAYAAGPGGQRTCYVFLSTLFNGCGADPGRYNTACTG
jgi:hypothetical protein